MLIAISGLSLNALQTSHDAFTDFVRDDAVALQLAVLFKSIDHDTNETPKKRELLDDVKTIDGRYGPVALDTAASSSTDAENGGEVVSQVVATMAGIKSSST